jgi:hypothetical protein
MKQRPISITIVGWLFTLVGAVALIKGLAPLVMGPFSITRHELFDSTMAFSSGLLACLSGQFMLRGRNWARWLCVVWIGAHVLLSLAHTKSEVMIHTAILIVFAFFLFRPAASAYFRRN